MLLYSDGISTHWSLDAYEGLLSRDPSLIAGVVYRDHSRRRDDATVVVVAREVRGMSVKLASDHDQNAKRMWWRRAARRATSRPGSGFDANDQTRMATAVSEIARNAYPLRGGGQAEFLVDPEAGRLRGPDLATRVRGSPDLKKILGGTYQSKTGMGLGIIGARRLMDDFQIESAAGQGDVVTLVKRLPPKRAAADAAAAREDWRRRSRKAAPRNILDELRQREPGAAARDE